MGNIEKTIENTQNILTSIYICFKKNSIIKIRDATSMNGTYIDVGFTLVAFMLVVSHLFLRNI
jgi:hypothetical protein